MASSESNRPAEARRPHPLRIALLLGLAAFVLHMGLADWLAAKGALRPINLFFDADCGWFIDEFATGDVGPPSYGPRCFVHPNVANLIEPPIAFAAAVGDRLFGRTGSDLLRSLARRFGFASIADDPSFTAAHALRTSIAVAIAPLAAAVRTVFLYLTLDLVGLAPLSCLLATLLCTVSASGLLFGAIPESFGLSGAVFAWIFHLVARGAAGSKPVAPATWVIAGALATSITITNLALFGLVAAVAFHAQERTVGRALVRATGASAAALLATALIFVVLTPLEGASLGRETASVAQTQEIMLPRSVAQVGRFAGALVDTLAPPLPSTLRGSFGPPPARDERVVRFTFRHDLAAIARDDPHVACAEPAPERPWRRALSAALVLAALAFSIARLRAAPPPLRRVARCALALLAFNALFHAIFGFETFLYSQHWLIALILALSVGMVGGGGARAGRVVVGALIVLAAIHSFELFTFIGARI